MCRNSSYREEMSSCSVRKVINVSIRGRAVRPTAVTLVAHPIFERHKPGGTGFLGERSRSLSALTLGLDRR